MPTLSDLRQRQSLPLEAKVRMTQTRIREWYNHFDGEVFVSFSGGKDSTVLAHLVRDLYPDVPLVFSNTGLEYPEVQKFARAMGAEFIRPKMMFSEVISTYGYPLIGKEVAEAINSARKLNPGPHYIQKRMELHGLRKTKSGDDSIFNKAKWLPLARDVAFDIGHKCCAVMKKGPLNSYQRKTRRVPFLGTLAEESMLRRQAWMRHGCNAYDDKKKASQPMSFWLEQDVLRYIRERGFEIASVYGDVVAVDKNGFEYEPLPGIACDLKCSGCDRTWCIFCGFGAHLEKGETRFQRLSRTHPRQYEYCLGGGQWVDNPHYDPAAPKMDNFWENWNPRKLWVPSKEGLGMKYVFDQCNQIYGKGFIRYE